MEKQVMLGFTGAFFLLLGVFSPVMLVSQIGRIDYFTLGKGDGSMIIAMAIISFLLTFKKKYGALWFSGLGSFSIIGLTFMSTYARLGETKPEKIYESLSWGWVVLFAGAVLVTATAAIGTD